MKLHLLNPLRWKKSFLILLLSAFILIWFAFIDTYSLKTRWDLYTQTQELKTKTQQLKAGSEELKNKIHHLEKNTELLEKIAREEYGMRKPGETVYKVKKQK